MKTISLPQFLFLGVFAATSFLWGASLIGSSMNLRIGTPNPAELSRF
jgi:hypothetical protein